METKNNKVFLETIHRKLGFCSTTYVDPVGLSGGLALWWKIEVDIDIETSSKNIVHTIISDKSNSSVWAASFIYGSPNREGRDQVWDDLMGIGRTEILPWLCIGNFNEILSSEDKMGGNNPNPARFTSFHGMLSVCGLFDLGFKGPKFTWRNNRRDGDLIMERIDMAFANAKWRELHNQAMVFVDAAIGSDHNPLILNTSFPMQKVGKPFRFESFWTTKESCKSIIEEAWAVEYEGTKMVKVCKKLRGCKEKLKKKLELGFNPDYLVTEKIIKGKLEDLWQKDAMFWHQRSRIKWLQMGDKNSRFFHLSTIQRRQRNQIVKLKDDSDLWKTEANDIAVFVERVLGCSTLEELYWDLESPSKLSWSFISLRKIESYVYEEKNYVLDSQLMRNYMQVKIGKEKDLEATLQRLRGKDADVSQEAAEIRDYFEIVQQLPKARFLDMFQRKYAHSLTVALMVKSSFYKFVTFEVPKTLSFLNCHEHNLNQNKDLTAILVFSGIQLLPLDIKGSAGSLITFCNWASAWVVSYGYIFILDWNPAGTFFILAGICASTVVFVAKLVPETKGRTLEEIQASLTLFT
ncbi:hypothetical protein RHGRI_014597 [Rhododendron griersonianum]|uniref:Endonuclease/exonuclease/phosphatase n=1 Tax=Rhododendron griersonianum TaxID=479676 RepID=A0AAV6K9Z3_9ERIC|nr:hypothetical protein RHGRI_014597 [Rhododendron griersonianum]